MGILRIMAVGKPGVGKSTIGNMLLGGTCEGPFETSESSNSCTQIAKHCSRGDCEYTDLPGLPDTNTAKTAEFYDIIIQEAKRHQTVILFVFNRNRVDPAAYKLAEMLFRELNKSNAAKILIINDQKSYAFKPESRPTEADYKEQAKSISFHTKIKFTHSIVVTAETMQRKLEDLKKMLSRMPDCEWKHLKSFTELREYVDKLMKQKNYQEELLCQQKEGIANLKKELTKLEKSLKAAVTATALATVGAFFTFGTSVAIGATTTVAAVAAATAIQMKEAELEEAKKLVSTDKLDEAARELQEACEKFEELDRALNSS